MAWIELHDTLRDHPKTYALADALNIKDAHAIGLVCCLWMWACKNAVDGVLDIPHRAIAEAAKWEKPADRFVAALVDSRWIDRTDGNSYVIHNWDKYAALLMDNTERQKENTRKRVARYRERKKAADVTQVTRYSNACNAPTIPNHTIPLQEEEDACACAREDEHGNPLPDPAWKQVSDCYLAEIGIMGGGTYAGKLQSYVDDMGADVVCRAIIETNAKKPDHPPTFLTGVLGDWFAKGVRDLPTAEAYLRERDRKRGRAHVQDTEDATPAIPNLDNADYSQAQAIIEKIHGLEGSKA